MAKTSPSNQLSPIFHDTHTHNCECKMALQWVCVCVSEHACVSRYLFTSPGIQIVTGLTGSWQRGCWFYKPHTHRPHTYTHTQRTHTHPLSTNYCTFDKEPFTQQFVDKMWCFSKSFYQNARLQPSCLLQQHQVQHLLLISWLSM